MDKASQETTTVTKTLSITDPDISQADYDRLRSGEKVEVEVSAPVEKTEAKADDDSDPSKLEAKGEDETEESIADGDDETTEVVKPKKKSGTQRRIEKLVKQRAEAEREREYWRQEALKHSKAPEAETKTEAKQVADGKPKAENFETHEEWIEAVADWKVDQKIQSREAKAREEKLKADQESKAKSFQGKIAEFKKQADDFEDVVADVDDVPMSIAVQHAILDSDNGPELMYELAKNREEYERICSLPALDAARAIGRFEARLSKATSEKEETPKIKTTKAPPPAKGIGASSASGKKTVYDAADMTQAEYDRLRSEQEKRRANY